MSRYAQRHIDLVLIFAGLLILGLSGYMGYRLYASEQRLIPISVLALIAGVIYEGRRLSDKWSTVLLIALGAFVFSFLAFLPGRREYNYNFENHIEMFPYWFIIIFAIFSIAYLGDKTIPKLTEGITLLQSLAVFYWVIDYGLMETNNLFLKSIMVIGIIFSFYSVIHAFTHANLSGASRLTLSIWSSLIMLLFSIDNIYRVYQNEQIENAIDINNGFYIGLQFFLLGVSIIYIIQNFIMIAGFLPGKGTFFNAQYFRDLRELKSEHIKRYSDKQVSILHSFFCVIFAGTLYGLNYQYQILPRHTAIWLVFLTFPVILLLFSSLSRRNSYR